MYMKNKNPQSIDETFEFTSLEETQKYIYTMLDMIEQGPQSTPNAHFLDRKNLGTYLKELATTKHGRIWSGYGTGRNALTFHPCTYFSLLWYTLKTKHVRLIIGQSSPSIILTIPLNLRANKSLITLHLDEEPQTKLAASTIMADVFPCEYIREIEDPALDLLKQFPPLPAQVQKESNAYGIWSSMNGLLLIANYQSIIVGTPIGWITIPRHTVAHHTAQKTKDPWRTLAALRVNIPHLKKNRVWSEAMAAELTMYVLEQGGQQ